MPLRIAHVSNATFGFDTANGVQHVVYCLARAQADIGLSVAVFSRDDDSVNILADQSGGRLLPCPASTPLVASLRQRVLSRYFEPRLAENLLAWQPSIVHFHSVHIPQNVALGSHLDSAGVPYCVTVHGALFRAALRRSWLKKTAFSLLLERRYLNESRFVHALTPLEAQVIRRHGINRPIVMVPNGPPPGTAVVANRPDALFRDRPWLRGRTVFMFIGRLDALQKGLDLLIEAFARAALPHAALVLAGPDYDGSRQRLTTLAERLGISSQVLFHDPVFGQDRANLLAAADVFAHPSRWEGMSMSVLTAAAAAKPCLITRAADPLGAFERARAAIIVEARVDSIAEGLKRAAALEHDALEAVGERAREVAESRFTWNATATELMNAYQCALTGEPGTPLIAGDDVGHSASGVNDRTGRVKPSS